MKRFLTGFLILFGLASCGSPLNIVIKQSQPMPAITDNEPMVIFTSKQSLPDSAEIVGDISTWYYPTGANYLTQKGMLREIERKIKLYGGNAIQFTEPSDNENHNHMFSGKVYKINPFSRISINFDSLRTAWKSVRPGNYEGFYETDIGYIDPKFTDKKITYICMKKDSNYVLVYAGGYEQIKKPLFNFIDVNWIWRKGDVFATLNKTVNKNIFKSDVLWLNKGSIDGSMFKFENGNLRLYNSQGIEIFRRIFPDSSDLEVFDASLSGFAINNNRIITCYHGVSDKDIKILIKGINKNFEKRYEAVVEKFDKMNDIAVLKLLDTTVTLGENSFSAIEEDKSIAEDVFVLGYPMSLIMGDEIKLTNGIISSKSGYAGDISTYQISAPVQPGNSGAPVFDKKGYLIGMINSKIMNADNVSYSIKIRHINEFLVNSGYLSTFRQNNSLSGLSLADQVKSLQNSIYLIEVMDYGERYKIKAKNAAAKPQYEEYDQD